MKNLILIFLPIILLVSCSNSNNADPEPLSKNLITGTWQMFNYRTNESITAMTDTNYTYLHKNWSTKIKVEDNYLILDGDLQFNPITQSPELTAFSDTIYFDNCKFSDTSITYFYSNTVNYITTSNELNISILKSDSIDVFFRHRRLGGSTGGNSVKFECNFLGKKTN